MPDSEPSPLTALCVHCGKPAMFQSVTIHGLLVIRCWECDASGPTASDPGPNDPHRYHKTWELWKKRAKP